MAKVNAWAAFAALWMVLGVMPGSAAVLSMTIAMEDDSLMRGEYLAARWAGYRGSIFDPSQEGFTTLVSLFSWAADEDTAAENGAPQASPIAPQRLSQALLLTEGTSPVSRYVSYESIRIPTNAEFAGSGHPAGVHLVPSGGGGTQMADFIAPGSLVRDADPGLNPPSPLNTAFFGQINPNTGGMETGVVAFHPGILPPGSGGVLDDPMFVNADLDEVESQAASVTAEATAIPEPATAWMLLVGIGLVLVAGRRERQAGSN